MRILVVDDSETMQRLIINALKNLGYSDFLLCKSGEEAMSILNSMSDPLKIDLILSDWHMPEMNGLQLLKTLKNSKHKDIPVIMLTSEQQKENILYAIDSGAADYIIKPLNAKLLKEKIEKIFGPQKKEIKKFDLKKQEEGEKTETEKPEGKEISTAKQTD